MRPHNSLGGMASAEFTKRPRHGRGDGNPAPTHLGDRSDALVVDVEGDLAGILTAASGNKTQGQNAKNPAKGRVGETQFEVVAGTGFEPVTFRL